MQLQKLPDKSVRLSRLNAWDVQTFRSLPTLADYTADPRSEKRLLPPPAAAEDLTPEMAMDWVEYVVPELREAFARDLGVVLADLATLQLDATAPDPEGTSSPAGKPSRRRSAASRKFRPKDDSPPPGPDSIPQPLPEAEPEMDPMADSMGRESGASGPLYALTIPAGHVESWYRAMNQARLVFSTRYGIDSENLPELARLLADGEIEHWFQYELFANLQGWLVEIVLNDDE